MSAKLLVEVGVGRNDCIPEDTQLKEYISTPNNCLYCPTTITSFAEKE